MILPIAFALIGAIAGGLTARRKKGSGFDIAQWAAVWALIGLILGFVALIVVSRMAG